MTFIALEARRITCDVARRTITGQAVPWDTTGRTALGKIRFANGSLRWPAELSRVKLLVGHSTDRPVGFATDLHNGDGGLDLVAHVPEGAAGDAALAEAENGLRDGLSVGVDLDDDVYEALWEAMFSGDPEPVDARGQLREVSLCAIPVFDDARVSGVAASREDPPMTAPAQATPPPAPPPAAGPPPATPPLHAGEPAPVEFAPVPMSSSRSRGRRDGSTLSLERMAEIVAAVNRREMDADLLTAALTDVTSADWITPPAYVSELAGLITIGRPLVTAFGVGSLPATGQKYHYPVVGETPDPNVVTGAVPPAVNEKRAIPTGRVTITDAEVPVETIAWGNDVSIQTMERSDPAFLAQYFSLCSEYYARRCDLLAAADITANATAVPGVADAADLLLAVIEAAEAGGRPVDVIVAALGFRRAVVGGSSSLSLPIAVSDVLGSIQTDPNLAAGTVIAGNREAFTWRENSGAPARLQAVNVSLLGYDLGIYGYAAHEVKYPESIAHSVVTVTPPGTRSATKATA